MTTKEPSGLESVTPGSRSMRRRVQVSAFLGAVIEWYDFYLYGYAAAVVLNTLFFPSTDAAAGTLGAFATLAVGWLARPLGAVVFGYFGDRTGRRGVLVATLLMMGLASALIGVLPTYGSVGVAAPVLLVVLRVVQGVSAGGEFAGAILMTVEHSRPTRRALASSVAQMGLYVGVLLANVVILLVALLPRAAFLSWGWRLPFLGSVLLVVVALWIRLGVTESPVFEEAKREHHIGRHPLRALVHDHWRELLVVILIMFGIATISAFQGVFLASYAVASGFTTVNALTMTLVGTVAAVIMLPISAFASDRIGRKKLVVTGGIVMIPAVWLALVGVGSRNLGWALLGGALPWIGHSIAYGPIAAWMSELFPTGNRYGGVSIGYQFSATLGAGFFPLIGTALLAASGGPPHHGLVYAYLVVAALVTLAGAHLARETSRDSFAAIEERGAGPDLVVNGVQP